MNVAHIGKQEVWWPPELLRLEESCQSDFLPQVTRSSVVDLTCGVIEWGHEWWMLERASLSCILMGGIQKRSNCASLQVHHHFVT